MNDTVRVKICGLSRKEDVATAINLNVWALGFIFYDQSPRCVSPKVVGDIIGKISEINVLRVGVFVNPPINFVLEAVEISKINAIQLHGDETPEFCGLIKRKLPFLKIIKAGRPQNLKDVQNLESYNQCDYILMDTFSEKFRGGTGLTSRWDLAQRLSQNKNTPPLILSGGLSEDNVASALKTTNPWAIDVSSSLEISPGIKSPDKMQNFMRRVEK